MDDAVETAILNTELFDTQKDDLYALQLFEEILTYNYNDTAYNANRAKLIQHAYTLMKQTVQHAIATNKIDISQNQLNFDANLTRYVNVLNTLSSEAITQNNAKSQFELELDKAHLFNKLGNHQLALSIIANMEQCGVDSIQQHFVNDWKKQLSKQKNIISYGIEGLFLDTIWVDTSAYQIPAGGITGDFSSVISSPNAIQLIGCYPTPTLPGTIGDSKDESSTPPLFNLYPNPSDGHLTLSFTVPEKSTAQIWLMSLEGRKIAAFDYLEGQHLKSLDLSTLATGVYLYRFIIDKEVIQNGTFVIE